MEYRKRLIFRSACAGMLLFGIVLISLGSITPDLREKLALNDLSAGTLFSVLPFGILAGSLFFGPIVDRYGYRILLAVSCIILSLGFEGIAFSASKSLITVYVFMIGCSGGAINGATNALVSDISGKNKGAMLSLLGVFFGIGALGMPMVLGILKNRYTFEVILASVGILTAITGLVYLFLKFPPPKQSQGFPLSRSLKLFKDDVLILIALFLFFQSSFEGVTNNWTTSYLISQLSVTKSNALFALSSFVAGMTIMRLITGSMLRTVSEQKILYFSFALIFSGLLVIKTSGGFFMSASGLFILGTGLACGFPIMLGLVGNRYAELSGTAFSLVLTVGLIGNMLVNYIMGIIASKSGMNHMITIDFVELAILALLATIIFRKLNFQTIKH
jgi:FHS family glucose/mannose:H+ symporter-like MFS transporter